MGRDDNGGKEALLNEMIINKCLMYWMDNIEKWNIGEPMKMFRCN